MNPLCRVVLLFALFGTSAALASPPTLLGRALLERAVSEFYQSFPTPELPFETRSAFHPWLELEEDERNVSPSLRSVDLSVAAGELALMISELPVAQRNDLITHLLADYQASWRKRAAIRSVLVQVSARIQEQVQEAHLTQRWPFLRILDRAAHAFILAEGLLAGRGLWAGIQSAGALARGGRSLRSIRRFQIVAREVAHATRLRQPALLAALGIGATEGAVEAYLLPMILSGSESVPLDPIPLLRELDAQLLEQNAVRTENLRAWACQLSGPSGAREIERVRSELSALLLEAADLRTHSPALAHSVRARDQLERQLQACLRRVAPATDAPFPLH